MNSRLVSFAVKLVLFATVMPAVTRGATSQVRVRAIIVSSQHLGAHGMGYGSRSLSELSKRLTPADIPTLISLAKDLDLSVGVQFGLASQCEAAILPVREAAIQRKMDFSDAADTMDLVAGFSGCSARAQNKAMVMRAELDRLREEEQLRADQEYRRKTEGELRIQRNGLKLLDPEQAKTLTHEERLEVFRSSLAAMGLSENGPMTPDQKKIVDRMYRSMVLGEIKTPPNQ